MRKWEIMSINNAVSAFQLVSMKCPLGPVPLNTVYTLSHDVSAPNYLAVLRLLKCILLH
jgi:hypothetical protein